MSSPEFNCKTINIYLSFWEDIASGKRKAGDGRSYEELTEEEKESLATLIIAGRLYKKACEGFTDLYEEEAINSSKTIG